MSMLHAPSLEILVQQQETLRQVIESISSELELRPLLTRIVIHACELLGADRGTIGLVDEERQLIRTEAVYNMPPDELGAEMMAGVGLAGQVLKTGQPLILNRYGSVEQPTQQGMLEDTVIGMPIFWREKMIGFFGIGAAPPRRFEPWHVETLALFARHAAVAIVNAQLYTESQRTLDETRLLYETSYHISTAATLDDVIRAYLNQVAVRGRYTCNVALYEFDEAGERQAVVVHGFWTPGQPISLKKLRIPYSYDALDGPLDLGQTLMISDVHTDPRVSKGLRQLQHESGRPALAMIPLMVRGERVGLVILSYSSVHEWSEASLRPYQTTAVQLAAALDRRWQQQLLLERSQQVAVLEERQRLARELHDSVTQLIFSVTLIAQSIAPAWRRSPAEGEQRVNRLLELSQSALAEMRALLVELHEPEDQEAPASASPIMPGLVRLKQQGLHAALERYATSIMQGSLRVKFDVAGYARQSLALEEVLFRIAQEALNNVVKHAQAREVMISLGCDEQFAYLTIADDGVGFSPPILQAAQEDHYQFAGMGLNTMRERAEALGGTLDMVTMPQAGTTIRVAVPRSMGDDA